MEHAFVVVTGIFIALAFFSTTFANIVMLIPGHFILSLVARITKVESWKEFDRRGGASMAVGFIFWVIVLGSAVAWNKLK